MTDPEDPEGYNSPRTPPGEPDPPFEGPVVEVEGMYGPEVLDWPPHPKGPDEALPRRTVVDSQEDRSNARTEADSG